MIKLFKKFRESEAGAVTVDWVVLTAAVVALAGAAYTAISNGTTDLTSKTSTFIKEQAPSSSSSSATD